MSPRPSSGRIVEQAGPYDLQEPLEQSSSRTLYRALHRQTGEPAAVTLLGAGDLPAREAIWREFHARAGLRHPNLATLRDEGLLGPTPWFAADLHEGRSLATFRVELWLQAAPLEAPPSLSPAEIRIGDTLISPSSEAPVASQRLALSVHTPHKATARRLPEVLELISELTGCLAFLHAEGFVHGSLGAQSVFLRSIDDSPVLLHPGLYPVQELLPATRGRTAPPALLPPEVRAGEKPDARTDLYTLGLLFYGLLTGQLPAPSQEPPSMRVSGLSPELDRLVLRLLAPLPERPAQASELARELAALPEARHLTAGVRRVALCRPPAAGRAAVVDALLAAWREGTQPGALVEVSAGVSAREPLAMLRRRAEAAGGRVLAGTCSPLGGPLSALADLWEAIGDEILTKNVLSPPRSLELANLERALLQAPAPDAAQSVELPLRPLSPGLLDALEAATLALASKAPLLLLLDRADLADELSAALLRRFLRGPSPVFVVLALPPATPCWLDGAARRLRAVALAPLTDGERATLAREYLGAAPPESLPRALAEIRCTDPWHVEQALRWALDEGWLVHDEDGWRHASRPLPPLADLLRARRARLGSIARKLLRDAEVARSPALVELLLRPADRADAIEATRALSELLRAGLVVETPCGRHAPGALLPGEDEDPALLRPLHRRIADDLGGPLAIPPLACIAHHLHLAGDEPASLRALEQAGLQALELGLPRTAYLHLERLLRHGERPPPATSALKLHELLAFSAAGDAPERALHHADLFLRGSTSGTEHILALLAVLHQERGQRQLSVEAAWRALDATLSPFPTRSAARALLTLGQQLGPPHDPLARRYLSRARWAGYEADDPETEAACWARRGLPAVAAGSWAEAERSLLRATDAARSDPARWAMLSSRLALAWLHQGELPRCLSLIQAMKDSAARHHDDEAGLEALCREAEVALQQGRHEAAAVRLAPFVGETGGLPPALAAQILGLFASAASAVRPPRAIEAASRLASLSLPDDLPLEAFEALLGAAEVLLQASALDDARSLLGRLEPLATDTPILRPRWLLLQPALHPSPPIETCARLAAREARGLEMPHALALALLRQGQPGAEAEARRLLARLHATTPKAFPET